MKNYRIEAAIVAVGLIVCGIFVKSGFGSMAEKSRVVNVKGLAEMEVKANKVTWPLTLKTFDNDLSAMYKEMNQRNAQVMAFLKRNNIKQSEITIAPPSVSDTKADQYSSNNSAARYYATSVITVTSSNVDLVRKLIDRQSELLAMGIVLGNDYGSTASYDYTDLNKVKPQMIEKATKNARATAEKFAKDSESSLGKIKDADQGLFSIDDRDANTPYIKKIRVVTTIDYFLKD